MRGFSAIIIIFGLITISVLVALTLYGDFRKNSQNKNTSGTSRPADFDYLVSGQFTKRATDSDTKDLTEQISIYQTESNIKKGFPTTFQIYTPTYSECYRIRDSLDALDYVDSVTCEKLPN